MQYVKVSASSCVLQFTRPSVSGLLDTVRVSQRESFASSGTCNESRYIVNLCFIFMGDKKFPTEWVFFELVSPPTSYTVISNPQPYFSRVLSFNEDSKHLLHTTWILNISIVSQNTVSKKASGYWPQFYVAGPNVFLLTTAISSNTAAVSEMACS